MGARSARVTDIARAMPGRLAARYNEIQRFMTENDVKVGLLQLMQTDTPFVWLITDLEPEYALSLCRQRMKIDETFRDFESLLGLHRIMNQRQDCMEQIAALVMLAYAVRLSCGETLRDKLFGTSPGKRSLYSGLFLLLQHKPKLSSALIEQAASTALQAFTSLITIHVRTHV